MVRTTENYPTNRTRTSFVFESANRELVERTVSVLNASSDSRTFWVDYDTTEEVWFVFEVTEEEDI